MVIPSIKLPFKHVFLCLLVSITNASLADTYEWTGLNSTSISDLGNWEVTGSSPLTLYGNSDILQFDETVAQNTLINFDSVTSVSGLVLEGNTNSGFNFVGQQIGIANNIYVNSGSHTFNNLINFFDPIPSISLIDGSLLPSYFSMGVSDSSSLTFINEITVNGRLQTYFNGEGGGSLSVGNINTDSVTVYNLNRANSLNTKSTFDINGIVNIDNLFFIGGNRQTDVRLYGQNGALSINNPTTNPLTNNEADIKLVGNQVLILDSSEHVNHNRVSDDASVSLQFASTLKLIGTSVVERIGTLFVSNDSAPVFTAGRPNTVNLQSMGSELHAERLVQGSPLLSGNSPIGNLGLLNFTGGLNSNLTLGQNVKVLFDETPQMDNGLINNAFVNGKGFATYEANGVEDATTKTFGNDSSVAGDGFAGELNQAWPNSLGTNNLVSESDNIKIRETATLLVSSNSVPPTETMVNSLVMEEDSALIGQTTLTVFQTGHGQQNEVLALRSGYALFGVDSDAGNSSQDTILLGIDLKVDTEIANFYFEVGERTRFLGSGLISGENNETINLNTVDFDGLGSVGHLSFDCTESGSSTNSCSFNTGTNVQGTNINSNIGAINLGYDNVLAGSNFITQGTLALNSTTQSFGDLIVRDSLHGNGIINATGNVEIDQQGANFDSDITSVNEIRLTDVANLFGDLNGRYVQVSADVVSGDIAAEIASITTNELAENSVVDISNVVSFNGGVGSELKGQITGQGQASFSGTINIHSQNGYTGSTSVSGNVSLVDDGSIASSSEIFVSGTLNLGAQAEDYSFVTEPDRIGDEATVKLTRTDAEVNVFADQATIFNEDVGVLRVSSLNGVQANILVNAVSGGSATLTVNELDIAGTNDRVITDIGVNGKLLIDASPITFGTTNLVKNVYTNSTLNGNPLLMWTSYNMTNGLHEAVVAEGSLSGATAADVVRVTDTTNVLLNNNEIIGAVLFDTAQSIEGTGKLTVDGGQIIFARDNVINVSELQFNNENATIYNTGVNTINAAITGNASLIKNGQGILTLTANNTYSGQTYVNDGAVVVDGGGLVSTVNLAADTQLTVTNGATIGFVEADRNTQINVSDGGLTGGIDTRGDINYGSGSHTITNSITVKGSGSLNITGNALLTNQNFMQLSGDGTSTIDSLLINEGVLQIDSSHSVSGSGSLLQNTGTTVNNGSLDFDVEIAGGSLSGSGQIGGVLTVGNGGSVNPGNSPGTLSVLGDALFQAGSNITFEIASEDSFDILDVAGMLTFEEGATIDILFLDDFIDSEVSYSFDFLNVDSLALPDLETLAMNIVGLSEGVEFVLQFAGNQLSLTIPATVSSVPVPGAGWLFISAIAGLVSFRKKLNG